MTQNDSFRTSSLGTCSLKKNIHLKKIEISDIKTVKSIFNLMLTGRVHFLTTNRIVRSKQQFFNCNWHQ